jgi:hypothetical protein
MADLFIDPQAGMDYKSGHEDFLLEGVAEHHKENKRQLEEMLTQPGRFAEEELGFRFALTHSEMEWLLQLLNDVRVGSWIQLGEPDGNSNIFGPEQKLTEQTIQLAWTMEMAGHFLSGILEAYKTADS